MSIINLFSRVVPNLTRQSYRDFESIHMTRGTALLLLHGLSIFINVALTTEAISNPCVSAYSSDAKTLLVTLLHFTEDQWTIFALLSPSASTITNPICDEWSLLLANEESVNATTLSVFKSSLMNLRPCLLFFCQVKHLFRTFAWSSPGSVVCAENERVKEACGWQTDAMYAPRAR